MPPGRRPHGRSAAAHRPDGRRDGGEAVRRREGFSAAFAGPGLAALGGLVGPAVARRLLRDRRRSSAASPSCWGPAVRLGAFDRFTFAGRIVKPSAQAAGAGLAGAPLLGVLFGVGWSPCLGPTLGAGLTLGLTTGTAARGAFLAFVYGLGVGVPFLIVAFAVERGMSIFGFARRHAKQVTRIGGLMLIVVGLLEVTGAWSSFLTWLQTHLITGYNTPLLVWPATVKMRSLCSFRPYTGRSCNQT